MKILAFVDKWIGLECAVRMIAQFPQDDYTFVLGPNGNAEARKALAGYPLQDISPETVANLRKMSPRSFDWLLNLWGHIIYREQDLALATRSLNIHPGLLPQARGSDPVVWTIRNGYEAGATLHEITPDIDAGPIYARKQVPYKLPIKGGELYDEVIRQCIDLFADNWAAIRSSPVTEDQTGDHVTHRRKQLDPDRRIPFDETISKLLAHDFNDGYRAIVTIDGIDYHASLSLTPIARSE